VRRLTLLLSLIVIAATMLSSVMESAANRRASRKDRVDYYSQVYAGKCKPQLLCSSECQDIYDFLRREGVDVGGPCVAGR
jgi:hypothetical protein